MVNDFLEGLHLFWANEENSLKMGEFPFLFNNVPLDAPVSKAFGIGPETESKGRENHARWAKSSEDFFRIAFNAFDPAALTGPQGKSRLAINEKMHSLKDPNAPFDASPYVRVEGPFEVEITTTYKAGYTFSSTQTSDFVTTPHFSCQGGLSHGEVRLRFLSTPSDLTAMKEFEYTYGVLPGVAIEQFDLIEDETSWGTWGQDSEVVVRTRADLDRKCSELRAKVVTNTE